MKTLIVQSKAPRQAKSPYYFLFKARNGKIVGGSNGEFYKRKAAAIRTATLFGFPIVDTTK